MRKEGIESAGALALERGRGLIGGEHLGLGECLRFCFGMNVYLMIYIQHE